MNIENYEMAAKYAYEEATEDSWEHLGEEEKENWRKIAKAAILNHPAPISIRAVYKSPSGLPMHGFFHAENDVGSIDKMAAEFKNWVLGVVPMNEPRLSVPPSPEPVGLLARKGKFIFKIDERYSQRDEYPVFCRSENESSGAGVEVNSFLSLMGIHWGSRDNMKGLEEGDEVEITVRVVSRTYTERRTTE